MRHSRSKRYPRAHSKTLPGIALAMLAGSAAAATADSTHEERLTPCAPLSCTGVDVGPFTPPSLWEFVPDRRPSILIPLFNGDWNHNDLGLNPNWYENDFEDPMGTGTDTNPANGVPDSFDKLIVLLDRLYDDGFRRIILTLPAGGTEEQAMSSSQWWSMPLWWRDAFETHIAAWIADKATESDPVSMGLYMGYPINNPCDIDMTGAHEPDPTDTDDMCTFYQNIKPWMDVGFKEFWLDASRADAVDMLTLQHSADYSGLVKFGGESIPINAYPITCSNSDEPILSQIQAGAWVSTYPVMRTRLAYNTSYDEEATEVSLMLNGHYIRCGCEDEDGRAKLENAAHYHERGVVLWGEANYNYSTSLVPIYDGLSYSFDYPLRYYEEMVKRVYSFGSLDAMIDFNNDGLLEVSSTSDTDYDLFLTAYYTNTGNPGGYLDGDVNGDGDVDVLDLIDFIDAASQWECESPCTQVIVGTDLGDPWWVP